MKTQLIKNKRTKNINIKIAKMHQSVTLNTDTLKSPVKRYEITG